MNSSVVLVIVCLYCLQIIPSLNGQQTFVIGGSNVNIADAPYMLSLRRLGHHICGAAVISEYWSISAGHCLMKAIPSQITLRGGNINRFLGELFEAERIVLHPKFNLNFEFDVAVIKTVQSMILIDNSMRNPILAIPLGLQGTISFAGSLANFTGWGMTEAANIGLSETLKITTVRFIDNNECNESLSTYGGATENHLCTVGTVNTSSEDFCLGDEGGPLIQDNRIVGIASWSPHCGSNIWPSVFTRITIVGIRSFIFNVTGL